MKDKEFDFSHLPDIINGEKITKENQHGCRKCKYDSICMYCGLDLRGYTREHHDKHLSPYNVLVEGVTEQQYYPLNTKCISVPDMLVDEIKELIEDYKIVAMKRHLDANNVKYKKFILYPCHDDYNKRKEMAIDYVYDMLLENGYKTLKECYTVGHNLCAGRDCIEVIVVGDFNGVDSFVGTIGYDEYISTRAKPKKTRTFKEV